jgi:hypothetical protein
MGRGFAWMMAQTVALPIRRFSPLTREDLQKLR